MTSALDVHYSSSKDNWRTPRWLLDVLHKYKPITLDPCTDPSNWVGAEKFCTMHPDYGTNGLVEPWFGFTYVNPPYGRAIGDWVSKALWEHYEKSVKGTEMEIVMLLPARTDTAWGQNILHYSSAVYFIEGRLKFVDPSTNEERHPAPFPSMLVYFGKDPKGFMGHLKMNGVRGTSFLTRSNG